MNSQAYNRDNYTKQQNRQKSIAGISIIQYDDNRMQQSLSQQEIEYATKGDFSYLLERVVRVEEELKHQREIMMRGFEAMDKRFEDMYKHFDKRFEDMYKHFDKRFEAVDKRFEDINQRFNNMITITLSTTGFLALLITVFRFFI